MARFLPDKELNIRKSWINTVLIIVLCMLLASCKSPEKANQPKTDNPDVSVTDKNTDEVKKEESKTSAPEMLEGDWILSSVEVEGSEWTPEEAGIESEISISISEDDTTATYFSKTEYTNDKFEAELDLALEPLYEGCSNDEWSVRFLTYNSTFGEADDFYATLIDENTLLLQHLYPFDGTQGVSYQTYVRK